MTELWNYENHCWEAGYETVCGAACSDSTMRFLRSRDALIVCLPLIRGNRGAHAPENNRSYYTKDLRLLQEHSGNLTKKVSVS